MAPRRIFVLFLVRLGTTYIYIVYCMSEERLLLIAICNFTTRHRLVYSRRTITLKNIRFGLKYAFLVGAVMRIDNWNPMKMLVFALVSVFIIHPL